MANMSVRTLVTHVRTADTYFSTRPGYETLAMTACTLLLSGLPHEVAQLVLILAIRSIDPFDPRRRKQDSAAIHALLTVRPKAAAGGGGGVRSSLTRAALMQMWWVDLDYASVRNSVPLLHILLNMSRVRKISRPLEYSQGGLLESFKLCHVDVVQWWYTAGQYKVLFFDDVEWKDVLVGIRHATSEDSALALFKWGVRTLLNLDPNCLATPYRPAIKSTEPDHLNATVVTAALARGFRSVVQLALKVWTVTSHERYSHALQPVAENKDKETITWALANLPWAEADCPACHVLMGAVETGDKDWIRWATGLHEASSKARASGERCLAPLHSLPCTSEAGQLDVIEWILSGKDLNCGLDEMGKLPPNTQIHMDKVALAGHAHVLEWWAANGDRLGALLVAQEHGRQCIVPELAKRGNMPVLKWWLEQKRFPVLPATIKKLPSIAAEHGFVALLEYCKKTPALARRVTYPSFVLTLASKNGHVGVLQWWKANKHRVTCGNDTLELATRHGHLAVLDWWLDKSGCAKLPYIRQVVVQATQNGHLDALEWWLQRSLLQKSQVRLALTAYDYTFHPSVIRYLKHHGYSRT